MKLEHFVCDLCGTDKKEKLFSIKKDIEDKNYLFTLVKCKGCGLVYMDPRPIDQDLYKLYPENYYSFEELKKQLGGKQSVAISYSQRLVYYRNYGNLDEDSFLRRVFIKVSASFLGHRFGRTPIEVKAGKVLDVGCGDGLFLHYLMELGYETYGVEISKKASIQARKQGLNVFNGNLTEAKFPNNYFDIVRLSHVLEHMPHPSEIFQEGHRILHSQGVLVVSIPNYCSLYSRIFKKNWFGLQIPFHLYQFSIRTVSQLLQKSGFKIANIRYYSVGTFLGSIENLLTKGRILCSHNPVLSIFSIGVDIFLDIFGWGDCIEIHAFK